MHFGEIRAPSVSTGEAVRGRRNGQLSMGTRLASGGRNTCSADVRICLTSKDLHPARRVDEHGLTARITTE